MSNASPCFALNWVARLLVSWLPLNPPGVVATFFHSLAAAVSFGVLLCLGCSTAPPPDPTSSYQGAESSFERGDLKNALSSVDEGLRLVGHGDPDSFWRLQLL